MSCSYTSGMLIEFFRYQAFLTSWSLGTRLGSKLLTFVVYVSILASFSGLSCLQFLIACSIHKLEVWKAWEQNYQYFVYTI